MNEKRRACAGMLVTWLTALLYAHNSVVAHNRVSQNQQEQTRNPTAHTLQNAETRFTGVYRFDPEDSDKLYSIIDDAASSVGDGDRKRFLDDLAIRLSSPDLLALERRESTISIVSSRAPRFTIEVDNRDHTEQTADGQTVRTRVTLSDNQLRISSSGGSADQLSVTFQVFDQGRRLRVTRRIAAKQLKYSIVVQSIYNKISDVAQWNIYNEQSISNKQPVSDKQATSNSAPQQSSASTFESTVAATLRAQLNEWIVATNANDIEKQMSFYPPRIEAFYLTRNVSRQAVRAEKIKAFRQVTSIMITASEPEIIFREAGRRAIMRFRKTYVLERGGQERRGQVVQELRWQQTSDGWKIISERDVQVLS